jgi:hypothetical protein
MTSQYYIWVIIGNGIVALGFLWWWIWKGFRKPTKQATFEEEFDKYVRDK